MWPKPNSPVPESWAVQGFGLIEEGHGILQPKNGPCGLVAVVLAAVVGAKMEALASQTESESESESCVNEDWNDGDVLRALARLVVQAAESDESGGEDTACATVVSWVDDVGGAVVETEVGLDGVEEAIVSNGEAWLGPGGALLLLYSLVASRGEDVIRREIGGDMGEPPLVVGPAFLCSMELLSLVMRGRAGGNVTAFHPLTRAPADWDVPLGIGLLSKSELEMGVPVADSLKSPRLPVWILHGGDHFTTAWLALDEYVARPDVVNGVVEGEGEDASSVPFTLVHFNGLPPAGPRKARMTVKPRSKGRATASKAPKELKDSYVKKIPGEIDSIVQAHPEDKAGAPDQWHTWRYEVVLAVDEPDVEGVDPDPESSPPPVFDQGEPPEGAWRCASCYRGRYKTMCFGLNQAGADVCVHCEKPQAEAGWSLWMPYADLPGAQKGSATNRHAPNAYIVLRRQWPGASISFDGIDEGDRWPSV